jgi:hypothetical protein
LINAYFSIQVFTKAALLISRKEGLRKPEAIIEIFLVNQFVNFDTQNNYTHYYGLIIEVSHTKFSKMAMIASKSVNKMLIPYSSFTK